MESKEKKVHIDVNLTDGYGNPTEVSYVCSQANKLSDEKVW